MPENLVQTDKDGDDTTEEGKRGTRDSILLVTNTQYSWKNCENTKSEWIQYLSGPQSKFEIDIELDLSPLYLKDLKSAIKKVGDRCAMLDVREEKDLRPVPSGTELEIVETFECFEKEESRDVGKLRRSLCDTIWELTPKRNGGCVPSKPNSRRESALALKKGNQTRPAPKVCHYATQAVADQFWLCVGEILLSALPLDWHGRCPVSKPSSQLSSSLGGKLKHLADRGPDERLTRPARSPT
ncbi:hypothetical protein PAMA_008860 [Pampus argenteus]